jgi:hypothetical protein
MNLPPDFKELLEEFAREGVEHVVIGGYAFAFHVEPRATIDLILLIEGSEENRERLGDGTPIRVIALNDLIANKRAAGTAPDLADVVKLERVCAKRTK